jgi:hypothetical protein
MTYLDFAELKNRTVLLSLIKNEPSKKSYDLFHKRAMDLSSFLERVLSKEIRSQENGR